MSQKFALTIRGEQLQPEYAGKKWAKSTWVKKLGSLMANDETIVVPVLTSEKVSSGEDTPKTEKVYGNKYLRAMKAKGREIV